MPALLALVLLPVLVQAQPAPQDKRGCSDPQLFPKRMSGYQIGECFDKSFDVFTFRTKVGARPDNPVEGRHIAVTYFRMPTNKDTSNLAIMRNYEAAITSAGGTIVAIDPQSFVVGKFVQDGREIWTEISGYPGGGRIYVHIVEKKAMEQQVVADAAAFKNDLQKTGHAAVYGILFDTNKATLKPESEAAIKEVATLLTANPALKLLVVGHTDSVGVFDQNMVLSKDRAEAVVKALTTTHGIAPARLKAVGCGPAAPVASNKTEDGRAKNRRVELVEQ
jgi:outer membrane protein OmpA-like peptidoglycan-associated protein